MTDLPTFDDVAAATYLISIRGKVGSTYHISTEKIISIRINGDSTDIKENAATSLVAWNDILDEAFPALKPIEV